MRRLSLSASYAIFGETVSVGVVSVCVGAYVCVRAFLCVFQASLSLTAVMACGIVWCIGSPTVAQAALPERTKKKATKKKKKKAMHASQGVAAKRRQKAKASHTRSTR